jgi:hypothetical protein
METVIVPVYGSTLAEGVVGRLPAKLPIADPGLDLIVFESLGDCGLVLLDGGRLNSFKFIRGFVPLGVDTPEEKLAMDDLDLSGVLCVDMFVVTRRCLDSELMKF